MSCPELTEWQTNNINWGKYVVKHELFWMNNKTHYWIQLSYACVLKNCPRRIISSEICIIPHIIRKPNPIIANHSNLLYSSFSVRQFVKWSALGHVMTTRLHSYHFIFTGHTEMTLSKHECMKVWIWVVEALHYEQRICFKHCKRKAFDWSLSLACFLCR